MRTIITIFIASVMLTMLHLGKAPWYFYWPVNIMCLICTAMATLEDWKNITRK